MILCGSACLALIVAALVQEPADESETTKRLVNAAADAIEAGDRRKAEAFLIALVNEAERSGREDILLAEALERLGRFYIGKSQERYAEAEPLLERAAAIRKKVQGPDHPEYAESLIGLALCQTAAEREDGNAKRLFEQALMIYEMAGGTSDADVARALRHLAHWHITQKQYNQAEPLLMRALANREKALGTESDALAETLNDLGLIHMILSRLTEFDNTPADTKKNAPDDEPKSERHAKKAEAFYKRALANREKYLKPDDPLIAESVFNLAQLAMFREQPAELQKYAERWLSLQKPGKAPPIEKQARVVLMLGGALMQRKQFDEADRAFAKTQSMIEKLNGEDSDEVVAIVTVRASAALEAGRFVDCERLLKQALDLEESLLGRDDRGVVEARVLMAGRYVEHARDRRGFELWNKLDALEHRVKHDDKHDSFANVIENYSNLLRRTNSAVLRPTEEDLAFLKKIKAVAPSEDLADLVKLDLIGDTELDDEGLSHIARLYGIQRLSLSNDGITDKGIQHLKDLTNLRSIFMTCTKISDEGLKTLSCLAELELLNLFGNHVTDAGIAHLSRLKNLRELSLDFTDIGDACLKHLEGIKGLEKLSLKSTKVTRAGIGALQKRRPKLNIEYEPRTYETYFATKPTLAVPRALGASTERAKPSGPAPIP